MLLPLARYPTNPLILGNSSVCDISAWGVLHTSYALHYAYLYYRSEESAGGLAFRGRKRPKEEV